MNSVTDRSVTDSLAFGIPLSNAQRQNPEGDVAGRDRHKSCSKTKQIATRCSLVPRLDILEQAN